MLVLFALSAGGGLLFLSVWARICDRRWREWERLLAPEDELRRRTETARVERVLAELLDTRLASGEPLRLMDEARPILEAGYALLPRLSPSLFALLGSLRVFSRFVMAMAAPNLKARLRLHLFGHGVRVALEYAAVTAKDALTGTHHPDREPPGGARGELDVPGEWTDRLRALLALNTRSGDLLWQWAERREQWRQPDDAERRLRLASLLLLTWAAGALGWSIFAA